MPKYIFLSLFVLASALAAAREHPENWIEVRSPHFAIVTNTNEKQGRRIAARFESIRAVFQLSYPELKNDPDAPVLILAVTRKDQFRKLEPATYQSDKSLPLHGMFVRASDQDYILMRLDGEAGNPYPLVFHEYTHAFLREAEEPIPLWLNEGLAEFYQSTEIYDREVLLGEPNPKQLALLREQKLLPLATLFAINEKSPQYSEKKKGAIFHAESWALTHYLTLKDYAEKTSKVQQYTDLISDDVDAIAAAVRVFGDLQKLQRSLELYIEQNSFQHFETKLPARVDDSQFSVKSMTPAEVQAVEANYLAASGVQNEAQALNQPIAKRDTPGLESLSQAPSRESSQLENRIQSGIQTDVPCPLSEILKGASERAAQMVDDLQRFTATEEIEHTEFRKNGHPRQSSKQLFNYTAEIDRAPSGSFWVEEYRLAKTEGDNPPISDMGTAAFALIFHPEKIRNFEFHCDERTDFHGTAAWRLRFEESPDPLKSFHQIRINRTAYQLRFKGVAWIAAEGFEVLRLQTDLVDPIPAIHLQMEHLDISYAPVEFHKNNARVWLPQSASMQISYRGRRYQRVHTFTRFQLFLVLTEEKVTAPPAGPGE